jgi:hypothetical protein
LRPDLKNAVQTLVQHENVAKIAPPDIGGEFHMIRILRQTLFALGLAFANTSAFAAPVTFNFTFDDPASTAQAVGSITFEDTLLANPGANDFLLPNPAVLALDVTVTGSAAGDGTFTITDFEEVVFDTDGGTLNFGANLVGQPTSDSIWGTPDGASGDFNLFAAGLPDGAERYPQSRPAPNGKGPNTPSGVFYFTLGANFGFDEPMVLTGMSVPAGPVAPPATLPIGREAMLLLAGMLGLVAAFAIRRRKLRA